MRIFVYGTLMSGRANSRYMKNAEYIGRAVLHGFSIYDLGYYPGIRPKSGGLVSGEVYDLSDKADFERICTLEGDGFLYIRQTVTVTMDNGSETEAVVFVYNSPCEHSSEELDGSVLWGNR